MKNQTLGYIYILAIVLITSFSHPAFAGRDDDRFRTDYGHDAQGRPTETQHGGAWGDTIITYDPDTGLEIYRKWMSPSGTLWSETFTNLQTGEVRRISYFDPVTGKPNRTEETRIDPRVLDRVEQINLARQRAQEAAGKKNDNWDFLPGFQPGMVRDAEDRNDKNTAQPEPIATGERLPASVQNQPVPSLPHSQLEHYREEGPAEIDYHQYGDTEVLDSSGRFSILNRKTGTITDFQEFDSQTHAITKLDGKVVQTDIYDQRGKLVSSKVLNPITHEWEDRSPKTEESRQKNPPKKISSAFDRADALQNPMGDLVANQTPTAALDTPAFAARDMENETGMSPKSNPTDDHYTD